MIANARELFAGQPGWLKPLAVRTRRNFATRPDILALEDALAEDSQLRNALKKSTAKMVQVLAVRPIMRPLAGKPRDWKLPELVSVGELADWFGISWQRLEWLAGTRPANLPWSLHYNCRWIRKRIGLRLIESPKPQLKWVQGQILDRLLSRIPIHDRAHGFCPKRGVLTYVQPHVGQACCLKMDLQHFFPSIRAGRVFRIFASAGYPRPVARILTGLCTTATDHQVLGQLAEHSPWGQGLQAIHAQPHLPQGAPTSPALANLAAFRFDCRLAGLARSANFNYSRYADDLLFSGGEPLKRSWRRLQVTIGAIAIEEGFEVNFRKTQFMPSSQRQLAAGVVLNSRPNLRRVEYDRLRATLNNCIQLGPASQNREAVDDFRAHLLGKIGWVNQLNSQRGEKLMQLFEQIEWS